MVVFCRCPRGTDLTLLSGLDGSMPAIGGDVVVEPTSRSGAAAATRFEQAAYFEARLATAADRTSVRLCRIRIHGVGERHSSAIPAACDRRPVFAVSSHVGVGCWR